MSREVIAMGVAWMSVGILLVMVRRRLASAWLRGFDATDVGNYRMRAIILAVGAFLVAAGACLLICL